MGCCKSLSPIDGVSEKPNLLGGIVFFIIGFFVIFLLIPVIWGMLVYFLFNSSIRGKENNILPAIQFLWSAINHKKDDDDYEEIDSDDEEDYELINYEKIE